MTISDDHAARRRHGGARRTAARWALWVSLGLVSLLAVLVAILHAAPVRHRVLAFALSRVSDSTMEMHADRLDYDLLRLRATIHDLRASAPGYLDAPFFEVERISVDIPWSSIIGAGSRPLQVQRLELIAPRLDVEIAADGTSNFAASEVPFFFDRPVPVAALTVERAAVRWIDRRSDLEVDLPSAGVVMDPDAARAGVSSGRAQFDAPLRLRLAEREVTVESLAAGLSFDGVDLTVKDLDAGSALATLRADGAIDGLLAGRDLALDLAGTIDLGAASAAGGLSMPASGTLSWSAAVRGSASAPEVEFGIDGSDIGLESGVPDSGILWSDLGPGTLALRGRGDLEHIEATAIGIELPWLTVSAAAESSFDPDEPRGSLRASVHIPDVARGLSVAGFLERLPFVPDAAVEGDVQATWDRLAIDAIEISADLRASRQNSRATRRLPVAGSARLTMQGLDLRGDINATIDGIGSLDADVRATIDPDDPTLTPARVSGRLVLPDLTRLAAIAVRVAPEIVPADLSVRGRVNATFDAAYTDGVPGITARIEGGGLGAGQSTPASLYGTVRAGLERLEIDGLVARVSGPGTVGESARIEVDGTIAFDDLDADLDVSATIKDIRALVPSAAAPWRPEEPFSPTGGLDLRARVTGPLSAPGVAGTLTGREIRLAEDLPARVAAVFSAAIEPPAGGTASTIGRTVIDSAAIEIAGVSAEISGWVAGLGEVLELQVEATSGDVSSLLPLLGPRLAELADIRGGDVAVAAAITGSAAAPVVNVRATSTHLNAGPIAATGTAVSLEAGLRDLGVHVDSVIDVASASVAGFETGPLHGSAALAAGTLVVDTTAPDLGTWAKLSVSPEPGRAFDLELSATGARIERLAPDAAERFSGILTAALRATGQTDDPSGWVVAADLSEIDALIAGIPVRLHSPSRLQVRDGYLTADPTSIDIGGAVLQLGGSAAAGGAEIVVESDLRDLRDVAARLISEVDTDPLASGDLAGSSFSVNDVAASGPVRLRLTVRGGRGDVRVGGDLILDDGTFSVAGHPGFEDVAMHATLQDGVIELERGAATWQGAPIDASGSLPLSLFDDFLPASLPRFWARSDSPARLTARGGPFTEAMLAGYVDPATLDEVFGRLTVSIDLEATSLEVGGFRGALTLETAEMLLSGVPIRQREPTRISLLDGRLHFDSLRWGGQGTEIEVSGTAAMDGDRDIDLRAVGSLDLRILNPFLDRTRTGGSADLSLTVAGTALEPDIIGLVTFDAVSLLVPEPRTAVTGAQGTVSFEGGRVIGSDLTATVNGGEARIGIDLDVADPRAPDGHVTLTARGVPFALADGLRVEVDSGLALLLRPGADPVISGSVIVPRGAYRGTATPTRQALAAMRARATAAPAAPSLLDDVRLDIRVSTGSDIRVDATWAELDVGIDLRVGGSVTRPTLAGRSTVREGGSIFLNNVEYRIRTGTVDFLDPVAIDPEVGITAETRVRNTDITLRMTGGIDDLRTELTSSDPDLSQTDIVSLLVTGRTASEAGGARTEILREQALGFLTGEYLSSAGRVIGLDTVRLERGGAQDEARFDPVLIPTESDTASRLTFAKNITSAVELVFSQDLASSSRNTWDLGWSVLGNLELRGLVLDDHDRRYELRHDFSFGGGSTVAPGRAAPLFERRVSEVRLEGLPSDHAAALRDRLRVGAGDRLDFYRWQEDRDRLEEALRRDGYLEARVVTRREAAGAAGWLVGGETILVYEIDRGPRSSLLVEGIRLPRSLLARMREAWSLSVFDDFLRDDLAALVREHMIRERFPQAVIDVSIEVESEAGPTASMEAAADGAAGVNAGSVKTARIRVDPGSHYRALDIEFAGNAAMNDADLRLHLRAAGLHVRGWLDPEAAARALRAHYAAAGLLAASVSVGDPVFEANRATLPITVYEGPQYRIATVDLDGVDRLGRERAGELLALAAGDAYTPATVEDAVRRLAGAYRGIGYSRARVTPSTIIDGAAAAVRVEIAVNEGPRQVVAGVEVEGLQRTRRSLVDRAMRLQAGDPADLHEIYRARKRLYDTGLFRTVDVEVVDESVPADAAVQPVIVRVRLQERRMFRLRWGVQVSDESDPLSADGGRQYLPGLSADLTHVNLLGRGATVGLAARVNQDYRAGRLFVSTPTTFGMPIRSSLFLTRSREDIGGGDFFKFVRDVTSLNAEQRLRPWDDWVIAYSYQFESNDTYDPDADPDDPFAIVSDPLHIARVSTNVVWDTRDHLVEPSRGWFHSSSFEMSLPGLGSDFKFNRYLLKQTAFRPLPGGLVSASAVRFGTGNGFGFDLIPSERFYAGGRDTVRGYSDDALGSIPDFFGNLRGGNAVLVVNQEVRFPIWSLFRGAAFLDAGNTFRSLGEMSLSRLKVGTGLGLRLSTDFVVIRLDYGIRLGELGDDQRGRWHFAIGHAF